jgi:hypothetical protein
MDSDEFVLAINPDPTQHSVRVEKAKYDIVREAILDNLFDHGPMTFSQLGELIEDQLRNDFDDSVKWYYKIVRQDMEVRGELRRAPKFRLSVSQIL